MPGVANTGSGNTLVADEWKEALYATFDPTTPADAASASNISLLPANPIDLLNPDFVELLRQYGIGSGLSPCNATINNGEAEQVVGNGSVSIGDESSSLLLCQAVLQSSVFPLLLGQTDRLWIYNVSVCYSDDDEIVSPRHYEYPPILLSASDAELQKLWKRYTQPAGLDALAVTGDHETALQLCSIAPLLFFTLQGYRPDAVEDRGNYMQS